MGEAEEAFDNSRKKLGSHGCVAVEVKAGLAHEHEHVKLAEYHFEESEVLTGVTSIRPKRKYRKPVRFKGVR